MPATGYGNGETVSIRVDNHGTTATKYHLSHQPALAELYNNDITQQVRVRVSACAVERVHADQAAFSAC